MKKLIKTLNENYKFFSDDLNRFVQEGEILLEECNFYFDYIDDKDLQKYYKIKERLKHITSNLKKLINQKVKDF